jgi:alpha-L-fucosidase 2
MKTEFLKRSRPNGTITLQAGDGCGHFTEQFAAAGAIAELLLQSVGDIIRVFPAWPKEKDAEFATLRAQGGFLVSAEQRAGKLAKLEIVSTVGGKLRLMDPWSARLIERETKPGEKMEFKP